MGPGGYGEARDERRCGSWTVGSKGREPPEELERDEADDEGERRRRRHVGEPRRRNGRGYGRRRVIEL